jgi:hypothetical protein
MRFFLGFLVGILLTVGSVAAAPKTIWRGNPVVRFEGWRWSIDDVELGFRDDGVVTWRKIPKEKHG